MKKIKKLILTICFCLITSVAFADHWVYISLKNKSGVTAEDDIGLVKYGDIIQVVPVVGNEVPTPREQEEFAIVRVTGLTEEVIKDYTEDFVDTIDVPATANEVAHTERIPKAYRKYRLKKQWLKNVDYGIYPQTINVSTIDGNIELKTEDDLIVYERKRKFYAYVKRPIKLAMNILVPSATAETVSKICATGANCTDEDYNTITAWETAVDGDLVADTRQETAEVYDDDGNINDTIQIDGSTTSSSYYLKITVSSAERHAGTEYGGGAKVYSNNDYYQAFRVDDAYSVIEWLIVESNKIGGFDVSKGPSRINNCVISTNTTAWNADGIFADGDTLIYNNIIFNAGDDGINLYANYVNHTLYNNTVYSAVDDGIVINYNNGTHIAINNLVIDSGSTVDYKSENSGAWETFTTNGSSDSTGSAGLQSLTTSEFESVAGGSEDLHLSLGATSINAGTDNGNGIWDTDIDGRDRDTEGDTWDLGADEYVAAVATGGTKLKFNML